ncbi:Serine/threonine-protein kinase PknH [Botrimarina colliarenosi]|uniref:Serine/threonine-protein kinase PknH n=1 Tax=Botrimarina colliarenosi TaxID=2528001 RepID=A0A5C6A6U9_9BACT|nr:serine/threonine-protein kinase [Botrimarina colliarenosi]TWT94801.1 Serine/threonine-protein kinase PknH [Botrimarina colliarenosi]
MSERKQGFLPTKATFELGDQIGSGTVGVVYRATSPDLPEPVAVKLLSPNVSGDAAIVERFEREIVVMERLNHPHIVRNYGGGRIDGQLFYAMQLLDCGSLKDRLRRGPLPWPQVAAYGVQIASALQHAHNHGIVHRDLKPSNLFYDRDGNLVLGDFGIARDLTAQADITQHGMTVGTFSYMSPEQITADARIDGKADLYSLGCVLFEMLTAKTPYQGASFAQVWDQHLHAPPASVRAAQTEAGVPVTCPEWLDELIRKLLSKKAYERPFNARAVEGVLLQHLLDEFGEEEAKKLTRLDGPHALPRGGDEKQRTWVIWVVLAALVVGLAYAAAGGSSDSPIETPPQEQSAKP